MKRYTYLVFILMACNSSEQFQKESFESTTDVYVKDTLSKLEFEERKKTLSKVIRKGDSLIAKNPNNGQLYYDRGKANFVALNFENSIYDFKKSVKLAYQKKKAYGFISDIFALMGEADSSYYYLELSNKE